MKRLLFDWIFPGAAEIILCAVLVAALALCGISYRRYSARMVALIAVMSALSAAGRAAFAFIPSVQPSSFIVILAGMFWGAPAGLAVGLLTTILSSLLLGMGPYVVWQAFCWGMMGMSAALLARRGARLARPAEGRARAVIADRAVLSAFGFGWGFLFGWITDMWYISTGMVGFSVEAILAGFAASFYFDLLHACTNLVLLAAFPYGTIAALSKAAALNAETGTGRPSARGPYRR